jgi:Protein of unknown function (DUF4007)
MQMRFSGHETFACRYAWIPKALHAVTDDPQIFSDEDTAMVVLGVGKNMVRSIRFWIEAAGMASPSERTAIAPTPIGARIFLENGHDQFMEDMTTLWLIHWNISTNRDPLLAWHFMLNRWQEPDFTESRAAAALKREVDSQDRKGSAVTLLQHLQIFVHSYLPTRGHKGEVSEDNLDCPLTELELLVKVGERERGDSGGKRESVYAFRRDDKLSITPGLFAYCVNDFWHKQYPNEKTLSARTIITGPGSPGQVFKIPEQDIFARLADLDHTTGGAIRFNESDALPQVRRPSAIPEDALLSQAYG